MPSMLDFLSSVCVCLSVMPHGKSASPHAPAPHSPLPTPKRPPPKPPPLASTHWPPLHLCALPGHYFIASLPIHFQVIRLHASCLARGCAITSCRVGWSRPSAARPYLVCSPGHSIRGGAGGCQTIRLGLDLRSCHDVPGCCSATNSTLQGIQIIATRTHSGPTSTVWIIGPLSNGKGFYLCSARGDWLRTKSCHLVLEHAVPCGAVLLPDVVRRCFWVGAVSARAGAVSARRKPDPLLSRALSGDSVFIWLALAATEGDDR